MGLDAEAMLEVNRGGIYEAARACRSSAPDSVPVVLSVATFGRGIRQDVLAQLEAHRHSFGHNQSLVTTPPGDVIGALLKRPDWQPEPAPAGSSGFWAMGYALGRAAVQWWTWDEPSADALF